MSTFGLTNTFSNPNPKIVNSLDISNCKLFNGNCRVKFRVCAKVTSPEPNAKVYGQFSAPVKPSSSSSTASSSSPKKKKEDEEKQDYYLNMGYAIRCLREEFPELFCKELSFDIYRDDIVFKDPLNTFAGIENYKSIFWALRFHGKIFFRALWIEIISVWQPVENVILVRWTVHGIPRVPWESRGRFDGVSEYKFDKNGKIYAHKVDNIALNSPRKFQVLSVQELILSLSCPSTPKPTCFEISSSSTEPISFAGKLNSVRHYLNSALDLSHRHEAETSQRS
ncbi:hypothetical protein BVRB_1g003830 [Beta vulgaris subsp. vulgaris]|uniref:uncharacterized protein LOC104886839 n=1 Tax=Beta vulgaris subsp. vulgaris TaxID=3555 RepID=UPI00053F53D1|nr:uncharacterized protein LOC104886839 [Beta vulgaris subsp. vulgaris]KMT20384.1 hypothetical protein BVRB_1g003830 [Beta vulgaris subsp. vulgaris]